MPRALLPRRPSENSFPPPVTSTISRPPLPLLLVVVSSFLLPSAAAFSASAPRSPAAAAAMPPSPRPPAIVYTIAGSDSGGGAGIQADLKAIHSLSSGSCHGCSAVTCLTAQNSMGVTGVHSPPVDFLAEQLRTLDSDLPPAAVKVGMLGTEEIANEVGRWLQKIRKEAAVGGRRAPLVVVDPVMISTSGHRLVDDSAKSAMIEGVFPHADLVTPNKFEAEELLGRELLSPDDVEGGAREILDMGPGAVLIKGGHSLLEGRGDGNSSPDDGRATTAGYAQDYLLLSRESSLEGKPVENRPRLCDGSRGVWLRNDRVDTVHTHGTGCTLSSSIATAWAMGERERGGGGGGGGTGEGEGMGALCAMHLVDACCVAKAYVNAGIARGVRLGGGPGPVVHTGFPNSHRNFPTIALDAGSASAPAFLPMRSHGGAASSPPSSSAPALGRILPIVDTVEWIERLASTPGVVDVQLRFKDAADRPTILDRIRRASAICRSNGVRLWINDHWDEAVEAGGCHGVHLGQEDLASCVDAGGLDRIRDAGLALGVSTHSYSELAAALGTRPSYVSLGPVFATSSKDVKFDPQGLETVRSWRRLIPPEVPLVAIGGIGDADRAGAVREAGADCAAVIGAVTKADDVDEAVRSLNEAMC